MLSDLPAATVAEDVEGLNVTIGLLVAVTVPTVDVWSNHLEYVTTNALILDVVHGAVRYGKGVITKDVVALVADWTCTVTYIRIW